MSQIIINQWRVQSQSTPGKDYVVSKSIDRDVPGGAVESYSCACKGWTMHTPRRDCVHIAMVKAGLGQTYEPDPLLATLVAAQHREARKQQRKLAASTI